MYRTALVDLIVLEASLGPSSVSFAGLLVLELVHKDVTRHPERTGRSLVVAGSLAAERRRFGNAP